MNETLKVCDFCHESEIDGLELTGELTHMWRVEGEGLLICDDCLTQKEWERINDDTVRLVENHRRDKSIADIEFRETSMSWHPTGRVKCFPDGEVQFQIEDDGQNITIGCHVSTLEQIVKAYARKKIK